MFHVSLFIKQLFAYLEDTEIRQLSAVTENVLFPSGANILNLITEE